MSNKIRFYTFDFGKIYHSDNVECRFIHGGSTYVFYKKGTNIFHYHNEYGPAIQHKDITYEYYLNNKRHRLSGPAYYNKDKNSIEYFVLDIYLNKTNESFVKNLANVLIPNNGVYL